MTDNQSNQLEQLIAEAELRRLTTNYAIATDALGSGDPDRQSSGRALYHEVFAPDARISAGESEEYIGPDAWADYVGTALETFSTTQHLVGTIDIELTGKDTARIATYLSATHEYEPRGTLWIVLGTYDDEAALTPSGWRITKRHLTMTSSEERAHDAASTNQT
ncbi:MAG: hypothetical protein CMQ20_01870 [Gammaproteobacteria bacterium]|jgi:hypothetical protein|nr:hypothetical protein [Gammaproteobacteria bacterium]|tara:strand:+ start:538 stop:1029 length:492 start_codon:yes stop_codon:yes gene_type:complete